MVHLLAIWYNFIELVCFDKALNNFIWGTGLLENFESKLGIKLSYCITKGIAHSKFAL